MIVLLLKILLIRFYLFAVWGEMACDKMTLHYQKTIVFALKALNDLHYVVFTNLMTK